MHPWRPLAGMALALLVAAPAGCGGSAGNGIASRSPTEIVTAAKSAADAASSVHVAGSTVAGGTRITLDLSLLEDRGGRGRLAENGLSFEVIELDGTIYIKGSSAFYSHLPSPGVAQLLQGRWLKASASSGSFAGLSSLTELHKLLDGVLDAALASHESLVAGGTSTVNGQAVVAVKDTTQGEVLYVASTGRPYPIEIVKSGANGGTITFSEWNKPVPLSAPANAVDLEQLLRG
jgi:hypothetical protein